MKLTIEIDDEFEAFGAYLGGTLTAEDVGRIKLNIGGMAVACAENGFGPEDFKDIFVETLAHEFLHAAQEVYGAAFDEKQVEVSIEKCREGLNKIHLPETLEIAKRDLAGEGVESFDNPEDMFKALGI